MRSRIYTIISGHFKSWYRSKSNIFWTIAFPLLLIVLFGAIFGNGSTKFDLYLQNQDLTGNVPTPLSQGYVNVLNQTGAFNLHIVAAEQPDPLTYVKKDAQLHNQGQTLLVIPLGFNATIISGRHAPVPLYMDLGDHEAASGCLDWVADLRGDSDDRHVARRHCGSRRAAQAGPRNGGRSQRKSRLGDRRHQQSHNLDLDLHRRQRRVARRRGVAP